MNMSARDVYGVLESNANTSRMMDSIVRRATRGQIGYDERLHRFRSLGDGKFVSAVYRRYVAGKTALEEALNFGKMIVRIANR